jgi:cell division protein YceG involved in septum cleavage
LSRGNRQPSSHERTEEERERARMERERRRAAQGREVETQQPAVELPVPELPPVQQPADVPPPSQQPAEAQQPVDISPPDEQADEAQQPVEVSHPDQQPGCVPHADAPGNERPQPVGEARAHALSDGSPVHVEPSRGPRRRRRGHSWLARLGALLALAAAIAAVGLLIHSLKGTRHVSAPPPPSAVKVVIPEGETRLQIAQIAAADGLTGSYRGAAKRSPLLNPVHYGAPRGTPDLEGFLFPATYDMNPGAPVGRLVAAQLIAFRERFGAGEIRRAHALHVTPYELLTIASMIEREAKTARDRPLIAAVIYNRLKLGMPLGIDATIYYALELEKGVATYTHELTEAQLQLDSPYNTRIHAGLPPTPISNPGMASIEAASHPAHVGYLYYVAAANGCGEHVFSTSFAQFERDAAAYQAAVRKNGGKPPTCRG